MDTSTAIPTAKSVRLMSGLYLSATVNVHSLVLRRNVIPSVERA